MPARAVLQEGAFTRYPFHHRANMAHMGQSRPDSGLGLQVKFLKPFSGVPSSEESSLGGGLSLAPDLASNLLNSPEVDNGYTLRWAKAQTHRGVPTDDVTERCCLTPC